MTMRRMILAAMLASAPAMPVVAQDMSGDKMAAMMRALGGGGLTGKKLGKAIAKAAAHPLGSTKNPVRADGPRGQQAYLSRLRCADATAPTFSRGGSVGDGPYGYIMDVYSVTCAGAAPVSVHMDMYHSWVEPTAVPGFTIVATKASDA